MKLLNAIKICIFLALTVFSLNVFAEENTPISDSVITTKIKAKIVADKHISVFNIDVSTNNGIVTLSGNVKSDSQASELIQLAQSTDGVTDVNAANLKVKDSKHPFSDTTITAKVKGEFLKKKLFDNADVSAMTVKVETNNGVVYLSGKAENDKQVDNAILIAKSVPGVKQVESRIKVSTH